MNKSDLIQTVSEKIKLQKKQAEEAVKAIFDEMAGALHSGKRIEIRGFGSFVNRKYHSYAGRNPRTSESIRVKPKILPFFKVGKELKVRVDGKN